MIGLYWPVLAAIGFLLLFLKANFGNKNLIKLERFGYTVSITNNFAGKTALFLGSLSFIPAYLTMDFSTFYPDEFRMQVYFDQAGLREALGSFPPEVLARLGVVSDKAKADEYYKILDKSRSLTTGKTDLYFSSGSEISSEGRTTFVLEKVRGIQSYHLVSAEGRLTHTLVRSNGQEEKLITLFSKIPSSGDFIRPSLEDILVRRSFTVFPKFGENVADYNQKDGVKVDHILIGLTQVTIWPVPGFGNTLYLYEDPSGEYVPVAYAVYY